MRRPLVSCVLVPLTLLLPAAAQMDVSDGEIPPKHGLTSTFAPRQIFIFGKVVLEDGSPLPGRAEVETVCYGEEHTQTRTDSHGGFSFSLSSEGESGAGQTQSASTGTDGTWRGPMAPRRSEPDWQGCELEAVLAGFTSEKIQLGRRFTGLGGNNIGQIVLHRITREEGLTISVTTALAPEAAQKAFRKGMEQESRKKWEEAQAWFEKALQIYPRYAVAWFELGRVQAQENNAPEARHCWQQAVGADPKYLPPLRMLAQVAAGAGQWAELAEVTGKWLALDSVDFADAWFLNSVGNYYAGRPDEAENSARQGIKLDPGHRLPKLQYLLGMILMQKQAYAEAAEHMQLYLHLINKPADVSEAQKQLAEIERLSASASTSGR